MAGEPEKVPAGPGGPENPSDTSFYILPDDARLRSGSGDEDGTPADDPEMRWLDEARIRDILRNLRLDEPLSADRSAAHNIIGYANGGYPGSEEWAGLARAADAVTFPVFAIDSSRRIIAWNQAMAELTGIGAAEMMGRGDYAYAVPFYGSPRPMLIDHVVIPPEIAKILDPGAVTRSGETYTSGLEEAEIKGRKVLIQGRATRIYDGRGRVTAAIQSIGISTAKPPARPVKTVAPAGMAPVTAHAGSPAPVPASVPASTGKAPAFPVRKNDEDLLRQRRGELTTAFVHLTDTEEKLLRNYEDLTRTQAQLIESERKVRAQELFLKCVISDAREGIVAFDRNLRYILWNRFMENLTGIPAQKVLGKRASELFPVLRVAGADLLLERALAGETVESPDFSFITPTTSKQVWVRVIYSPLTDAGSAISGVIGVIQ
ncbi:MAG TPA: PAS domain-containing protein, partial [Methanoregula sp.]|nr:PAS domain-containing protein [Methanoregula sp.]